MNKSGAAGGKTSSFCNRTVPGLAWLIQRHPAAGCDETNKAIATSPWNEQYGQIDDIGKQSAYHELERNIIEMHCDKGEEPGSPRPLVRLAMTGGIEFGLWWVSLMRNPPYG